MACELNEGKIVEKKIVVCSISVPMYADGLIFHT